MDFSGEKAVRETMEWVVDNILIPHFHSLGLNASGEWLENINSRAEGNKGIINGRKYSEQLVWGRKPGRRPPISALEKWAQVKLGLSGKDALGAAFAIANKIAKEGTTIYQDGGTDLLEILEKPETIRQINERLSSNLLEDVKIYLERKIQS